MLISSPKFKLTKQLKESNCWLLALIRSAAFRERSFFDGSLCRNCSSSLSSHRASLEVLSNSSRAPLDLAMLSLVRTSATIRGCGDQRTELFDLRKFSRMMASSMAVLLSCLELEFSLLTASNKDLASVTLHCSSLSLSWHSSRNTVTNGAIDLRQSSR